MRTLLTSSAVALATLLGATPAFAQCYCNLYGQDGGCADMTCYGYDDYRGSSYYDPYHYNTYYPQNTYYEPYYAPSYAPNYTSSSSNSNVNVTVRANDSLAEPGDTVTYTITVRNTQGGTATTDVRAELDSDMSFVSATSGGDEEDDVIRWDNVRVPSRGTKTLTLRVRVRSGADDNDRLLLKVWAGRATDTATIRVDDDNRDNNDDDDDEDLRVTLSDSPDPVSAGDVLTYTIRIDNRSDRDLEGIQVRAMLDNDTRFLSASDDADDDDDEVEWDDIDIDEDEEETLTLRVRVGNSVRNGDTLRLRVEVEDEEETLSTRVGYGSSNANTCTYYNSYLQQYYLDYCDERHEDQSY